MKGKKNQHLSSLTHKTHPALTTNPGKKITSSIEIRRNQWKKMTSITPFVSSNTISWRDSLFSQSAKKPGSMEFFRRLGFKLLVAIFLSLANSLFSSSRWILV